MATSNPGPGSQRASVQQRWWVVNAITRPGGPRGPQQTNYEIVQSRSRPTNAVAGPFTSRQAAETWQTNANTAGNSPGSVAGGIVSGWLGSLGAKLASGIEAGTLQILKDIWNVIVGPLEVFLGIAIAIFVFIIYFKDDLTNLASAAVPLMMAA